MAKLSYKLTGVKELQDALKRRPKLLATEARRVTEKHGELLVTRTKKTMTSTYTGHYEHGKFVRPTGATKNSVDVVFSNAGLTATVSAHTEYFPYLEYGTRFMSPRPTLRPAWTYQSLQYINDLKKLMK